jgi:hypothetical protein
MNVVGRGGLARRICGKHEFNVTNKGSMPRGLDVHSRFHNRSRATRAGRGRQT